MRVAGEYVIQHHSKGCTGDTMLATAAECSKAKAALDPDAPPVRPDTAANAPSGCSRWQGKWYFNDHTTGQLDGESEPICRSDKAGSAKYNLENTRELFFIRAVWHQYACNRRLWPSLVLNLDSMICVLQCAMKAASASHALSKMRRHIWPDARLRNVALGGR